jgi:hypothetical protein
MTEARLTMNRRTGQMELDKEDLDQRHGLYIDNKLIKTYATREQAERIKQRDPKFRNAVIKKIAEDRTDKNEMTEASIKKAGRYINAVTPQHIAKLGRIESDLYKKVKESSTKSMRQAANDPTGPKFSGYLKGTDSAPTEYNNKVFGGFEESTEVDEGIMGNMTVRSNPLTAPARNKPTKLKAPSPLTGTGKAHNILMKAKSRNSIKESDNFLTWAVRVGYNIFSNPAVYESARKEYNLLEGENKDQELGPNQYYLWRIYFDDGSNKLIKVTQADFDPKTYYAKKNKVVINVDYNWNVKNG